MSDTFASDEQLACFGKSRDELVYLADEHTLAVQMWLASRSPQGERAERNGVRLAATGLSVPLLNLALGSQYPPNIAEANLAQEIEAVKAFFARRRVPWYWWLSPRACPPDIGQHLQRHGLTSDPPPLPAMIAPLPTQVRLPAIDAEIRVWRAATQADLQVASMIRRVAFRFPEGVAVDYFEAMAVDWLDDASPARLYLAGYGDRPPAAIGALIMGADLPGVYVMATLPEYRRLGLGKAILNQILVKATADKHPIIVLTASRMGYPLYAQFGFLHLFDYTLYKFSLQPPPA